MSPNCLKQLNLSRSDRGIRGEIDSEANDGSGHYGVPPIAIISQLPVLESPTSARYPLESCDRMKFSSHGAAPVYWSAHDSIRGDSDARMWRQRGRLPIDDRRGLAFEAFGGLDGATIRRVRKSFDAVGRGGRCQGRRVSSLLLGIAIGFFWAPCAGPILGLVLTGAAISGHKAAPRCWLYSPNHRAPRRTTRSSVRAAVGIGSFSTRR